MSSGTRWILVGFLAIALFFLLTEHWAHLLGILPYLLLLACPLMHLFHRHGHHGHTASEPAQGPASPGPAAPDIGRKP
ncbi:DUF2933 domain-containing protein [Massilia kyonggiensis]|nr:DUF2933 domain-containing protein [Massilia kyonggiensis]